MDSGPPRAPHLEQLGDRDFDLLVVGGGIVGCGVARDAALRGLDVALIDKGDFASGTSSKSSKLVHGGLRYLEQMQFGLVFESLRERRIQRVLNPHLVWPVPFIFPVYKHHRVSLWKVNVGMWLYALLSLFRVHKMHRRFSAKATVAKVPGLKPEGLSGSVYYYDCGTDDARLTLANALGAERAGATTANYVTFKTPIFEGDAIQGAHLEDGLTGTSFQCRARHIVFCGGPWTDEFKDAHGDGQLLRRTKGVHIVIPHDRLPVAQVTAMGTDDGRAAFAIPFHNCVYIGTTDTDYDGSLDALAPTRSDIEYLLAAANDYFPDANLTFDDVRSTWSGLRPLVRDDAADASATSREHIIATDPTGQITTVAGGKLTTYRAMAEEVVDNVVTTLAKLGEVDPPQACATATTPLDPDLPPTPADDDAMAQMLWRHHGSGSSWIAERLVSHPEEAEPVAEGLPYVMAQVSYATLHERAETVADILVRRLQVFYRASDQGLQASHRVASHMAMLLGRDSHWAKDVCDAYAKEVALSRQGIPQR